MTNPRVKKSIRTLAKRQKAISQRPLSEADIADLNRTFEKIDKVQEEAEKQNERMPKEKKIAQAPEADV
jgi:hypothetical protein